MGRDEGELYSCGRQPALIRRTSGRQSALIKVGRVSLPCRSQAKAGPLTAVILPPGRIILSNTLRLRVSAVKKKSIQGCPRPFKHFGKKLFFLFNDPIHYGPIPRGSSTI
jgi:hypothetical protein